MFLFTHTSGFRQGLLALLLASASLIRAEEKFFVRSWQSDEGLPDNSVLGIGQTPDGFLWVATLTGVVRFDGLQFLEFPLQTPGLEEGTIQALCTDRRGRVWVAMGPGIVVCLEQGRTTVIHAPDKPVMCKRRGLIEDGEGAVWASFVDGSLLRVRDGESRVYTAEDGLPGGGQVSLTVDPGGQLWFLQSGQVGVFRKGRFLTLGATLFSHLCAARAGGVWLCTNTRYARYTEADGLFGEGEWKPGSTLPRVSMFLEDQSDRLWIGTSGGLFCYEGAHLASVDTSQQTMLCLNEDREGNIWLGTRGGGLKQLKPRIAELLPLGPSVPSDGIQSLCKDTGGQLWAVSWYRGSLLRNVDHVWKPLSEHEGWPFVKSKCVAAEPHGGIWIGTEEKGIFLWKDGAVLRQLCNTNGLVGNYVNALRTTPAGALWIGGYAQNKPFLQRWEDGRLQTFELPANKWGVTAMEVDTNDVCWVATARGKLVRIEGTRLTEETDKLLPRPAQIRTLLVAPDSSLWIGYGGLGLGRLKKGVFTHCRREQGLHDDYISQILYDGRGRLWLAGNRGVFSLREREWEELAEGRARQIQSVVYHQEDGLPVLQASFDAWPCSLRDADGRLHFAMQSTVATLHPHVIPEDTKPPNVFVDRVTANGKVVALYGAVQDVRSDATSVAPLELGQGGATLKIPLGRRQVEFSFTAPTFTMPESIQFRYQLLGLDTEWIEAGTRRSVFYSRLAPGRYQFHVIACNRDGVWNDQGASLEVIIPPFWWEKVWFRVGWPLCAFGIFGGLVVAWLRRRQKLQLERVQMQQAMERERSRIAADLHDGMGSDLTLIGLLCERARQTLRDPPRAEAYLDKVLEGARVLSGELDAVVWSVNPANDTVEQFVLYFTRFVQNFLTSTNIRLRLVVPDELSSLTLSAVSRHQLFMAAKEALHNVVKHAGAKQVTVRIRLDSKTLIVEIEDDGCGLPAVRAETAGADGLTNMARRMDQAGGRCECLSGSDGRGTRVQLTLPLPLS